MTAELLLLCKVFQEKKRIESKISIKDGKVKLRKSLRMLSKKIKEKKESHRDGK